MPYSLENFHLRDSIYFFVINASNPPLIRGELLNSH
jgi:hypothetical protein